MSSWSPGWTRKKTPTCFKVKEWNCSVLVPKGCLERTQSKVCFVSTLIYHRGSTVSSIHAESLPACWWHSAQTYSVSCHIILFTHRSSSGIGTWWYLYTKHQKAHRKLWVRRHKPYAQACVLHMNSLPFAPLNGFRDVLLCNAAGSLLDSEDGKRYNSKALYISLHRLKSPCACFRSHHVTLINS